MAVISYMQRRKSGTYEFRRRLPEALAGKPVPVHMRLAFPELVNLETERFKHELVRSLGTKDMQEGKRRNHQEAIRAADLFEAAIAAMQGKSGAVALTEADIREIAEEAKVAVLAADEEERTEGDDRRRTFADGDERAQWPDLVPIAERSAKGMSEEHFEAYGPAMEELLRDFRTALARRDPKIVEPELRMALRKRGLPPDALSPDLRWRLGMEILRGVVEGFEGAQARQRGEQIPTPMIGVDRGPTLSEAFAAWQTGSPATGAKKPGPNTIVESEQAVRRFRELHGDMRLGQITREKAREFRDAMAQMPKGLPEKLRKLPLPKLLERRDLAKYPRRSATTINKSITLLGAIISNAEREGRLDKVPGWINPFGKGLRLSVEDRREDGRQPFDKDSLRVIFGSAIYSARARPQGGAGEAAFWLPLIGLLSGMRLSEIAQLRVGDLAQDEEAGRWFFDVGRVGGRLVKTASSIRRVPVHPDLTRIGLIDYRRSVVASAGDLESPLWPALRSAGDRPRSVNWSKWFGRWLDKLGITGDDLVFHSFRHSFKRMARDAGIAEEMHDALTGHAGGRGEGRGYGPGFSLKPLCAAMDTVVAPVDLSGVVWEEG